VGKLHGDLSSRAIFRLNLRDSSSRVDDRRRTIATRTRAANPDPFNLSRFLL
jgi:hypothetical protein